MTAAAAPSYAGASTEAIRHHYDLGNDFFALWLDPERVYSCALWDGVDNTDDTLEAAQARKLDHLVAAGGAAGAARVLDIGCGWGGLMRRMVDRHGVGHVTGLTLSAAQAEHVRDRHIAGRPGDRIEVRVENWTDHEPAAPYDAIVSIGAFEHFADFGLGRAGRVAAYQRFFDRCRDWLPPGGRLGLQTIVKGNNVRLDRQMTRDLLFIVDRIFPESELPWPSELLEAAERRFDVVALRNDAEHYARTCQEWHDRLAARRDEAVALVGPEAVADYERYLSSGAEAFRRRHLGLMRVSFERPGGPR